MRSTEYSVDQTRHGSSNNSLGERSMHRVLLVLRTRICMHGIILHSAMIFSRDFLPRAATLDGI